MSEGEVGFEETSVYVLFKEVVALVFVIDAMLADISPLENGQKETVGEGKRRTCPTITKERK